MNDQLEKLLKEEMKYTEDQHCANCVHYAERDMGSYECRLNGTYFIHVSSAGHCRHFSKKEKK